MRFHCVYGTPDHERSNGMRALVIHSAKDLRLETRDAGTPGPGEVAVRLSRGGICGSDLHYFNHGGFGAIRLKEPMILGHEVSGHIAAVGTGVEGLTEGTLVAVSPSRPCGACGYCQSGAQNHCLNMAFYGSAMPFPHIQGAFSDVLIATAAQCVPADGLSPGLAAMAEPLAVCLHGTTRAGPLLGKRVLITGCGPIGALSILTARRAGAAEIVVADISAQPLSFARALGADRAIDLTAEPDAMDDYTDAKGHFDMLFEASGAEPALVGALAALRPRAVIVQLGLGGDMALPINTIVAKELELRGSFRFHEEFGWAVRMMQQRLIDPSALITQTYAVDDAVAAFALASDRSQAMKVQIDFD